MTPDQENAPDGRKSDSMELHFTLTRKQACALSAFLAHIGWREIRAFSGDPDDQWTAVQAMSRVQAALGSVR